MILDLTRAYNADGIPEGKIHLNFTNFFGKKKYSDNKTNLPHKTLLTEIFKNYFPWEMSDPERIQEIEGWFNQAKKEDISKEMKEQLEESYKIFQKITNSSSEDNIIQMMNKYKCAKNSANWRFTFDGFAVLLDPYKFIMFYSRNIDDLQFVQPDLQKCNFESLYDAFLDTSLDYITRIHRLRKLGKNGYIQYDGNLFNIYDVLKFLNKKKDVEIGLTKKKRNDGSYHYYMMLNQDDRFVVVVPKKISDEDKNFIFNIGDIADEQL